MAVTPLPRFIDLIHRAEAHEIFQQSISTTMHTPAAFSANTSGQNSYRGSSNRQGGQPNYRGSGRRSRRGRHTYVPRCQLCKRTGHKASQCREYTLQRRANPTHANLAEAFNVASSVANSDISDWFLDSSASSHMTPTPSTLDVPTAYHGKTQVIVGNGNSLTISHVGHHTLSPHIILRDILVVPQLTHNLLSISRLTYDLPVNVYSEPSGRYNSGNQDK